MRRRRERTLEAYRDGNLSERQRARVQKWLERDPESLEHIERTEALGRAVCSAWTEGPAAPSADRLMASIRPEMRRIDAERRAQSVWSRARQRGVRWRDWLGPLAGSGGGDRDQTPSLWEWASAGCVAATAVVVAVLAGGPGDGGLREAQHLVAMPTGPIFSSEVGEASSIYDLAAEGDTPIKIYEREGAAIIFFEPLAEPDDVSLGQEIADWA